MLISVINEKTLSISNSSINLLLKKYQYNLRDSIDSITL